MAEVFSLRILNTGVMWRFRNPRRYLTFILYMKSSRENTVQEGGWRQEPFDIKPAGGKRWWQWWMMIIHAFWRRWRKSSCCKLLRSKETLDLTMEEKGKNWVTKKKHKVKGARSTCVISVAPNAWCPVATSSCHLCSSSTSVWVVSALHLVSRWSWAFSSDHRICCETK